MTDYNASGARTRGAKSDHASDPGERPAPATDFFFALSYGTPGDDTLQGLDGNNVILGVGGNDQIRGNGGNDIIVGGRGNDDLQGGAGNDVFVYSPGDGNDVIRDFEPGDRILLLGISADEISFIPTPSGLYDPPSGIDLIYRVGNVGTPIVYFPGLTNADFQSVQDAIIFA